MLSYDVVEWGHALEKIERATSQPHGTEVLVRLKYCGVCHSDVHIRDGYFDLGGGKRLLMSERGMRPPVTLGHEPFGTAIAAGPDAEAAPLGQDRLVYPWTGCGACPRCREGLDNYCMTPSMIGIQRPGGYADHLIVPHPRYLIDAEGMDPAWAATLSCSGLSAYSAVVKLTPIPSDEWVAVMGAGGLGLAAIGMLRALGHDRSSRSISTMRNCRRPLRRARRRHLTREPSMRRGIYNESPSGDSTALLILSATAQRRSWRSAGCVKAAG